jgi:hypothetical protein
MFAEAERLADNGLIEGRGNRNVQLKYVRLVDEKALQPALRKLGRSLGPCSRIGAEDSRTSAFKTIVTSDGRVVKAWAHIRTYAWKPASPTPLPR